jgi:hypothetical protein
MDLDWTPYAADSIKEVEVTLHTSASPFAVFMQDAGAGFDLTPFVQSGTQSPNEVNLTLRWHMELYTTQPAPGQVLEIKLQGQQAWVGIIDAISDYQLASGSKSMSITARSRGNLPRWRDIRQATDIYPLGTPVNWILQNIAEALGLDLDEEYLIPAVSLFCQQSNVQLADLTPWQMLTVLLQPVGLEPFFDARGRLKTINRDLTRQADIVLEDNRRLISVQGGRTRPPVTEVEINWLNPKFVEVSQQDQVLARANITAGFFQLEQRKEMPFSEDKTQRARNTVLVVRQSANSGLLEVCDETYTQLSMVHGEIVLETHAWVPALVVGLIVANQLASGLPDVVAYGYTIPVGKIAKGAIELSILLTMASIGTGMYEVWGTPYDFVKARNRTVAYNPSARDWEVRQLQIESDFLTDEAMALNFATRELIYNHMSANARNLTLVDDPRIEPGDIIQLANGEKVFVTDYTRDLGSGSAAVLKLQGFQIA